VQKDTWDWRKINHLLFQKEINLIDIKPNPYMIGTIACYEIKPICIHKNNKDDLNISYNNNVKIKNSFNSNKSIYKTIFCSPLLDEHKHFLLELDVIPNKFFNKKQTNNLLKLLSKTKNYKIINFTDFNQPIHANQFPYVEKITFDKNFNSYIDPTALQNCKEITFGDNFSQMILANQFPAVEKITFGKYFNGLIDPTALKNCKTFYFPENFGYYSENALNYLKKLFNSGKDVIININKLYKDVFKVDGNNKIIRVL
jgi:hypothetical protein